jgi:MoxR-like ATPase
VTVPVPGRDDVRDPQEVSRRRDAARAALRQVLAEIQRVIIGQDAMLERVLVSLLAGGHVLLEGVPGLAKTLTVRTLAESLGGSFGRIQFTPDLVPSDVVGTRVWRPDTGSFDTELGPVFRHFLLADEINRAPAKVQSALLEVMEERQVTIGGVSHSVPAPFIVLATQNPLESEGTYPLPEAQVDRFLMKIVLDYPSPSDEASVVHHSLTAVLPATEVISIAELRRHAETAAAINVGRDAIGYAVALVDATRHPAAHGLAELDRLIEFGASPRGSIGLIHAARVLALLRGRDYVTPADVRDLTPDLLRHRVVVSYDALSEGVSADDLLARILATVPEPGSAQTAGPPTGGGRLLGA